MKKTLMASAVGAVIAFGAQTATAAAPADWNAVAATDVTLFYPACRRWNGSPRVPSTVVHGP